ncbi:protein kinase domain-containing protein [Marinicella meishanensis]|uniref:serine/threonine-protein kinase n=1 Tax=Marinicella meishanensis TaxID=2873263 RepID=UPI001CBDAA70|nr:protein kinase [Marinicella sp. NBU2979]
MSDQTEVLQQLADSLADDLVIDWALADSLAEEDEKTIRNLGVLGQIAQLQGQATQFTQTEPSADPDAFRWGHLKVQDRLGDGVYGEVFRAHDEVLERQVALKLLKTEVKSAVESMRFIDEARRMARVRHPHVLAIHGADVNDGRAGFWADLIEGQTLDQPTDEALSAAELLAISDDLSAGLAAIHRAGIVHGDIKPANIIKDDRGGYLIMDFGAGGRMDAAGQTGPAWQGTPLLMAPELILQQQSGPAADVYALGATLFKMATGQYPVVGETLAAIQQAHQQQQRQQLRPLRPDLEPAWVQLIEAMLQPEASLRPTAQQIQRSLRHIEQLPQQRKNRRAVLAIIGVLVLGLLLSGWGFYRAEQQKQAAITAKNQAEAISGFLQDMLHASAELGLGRDVTVADMLDIAGPEVAEKFADQPPVAAALFDALANSYNALRDTEQSLDHANSALVHKQSYLPADDPEIFRTLLEIIQSHQLAGRHEASLALIDKFLAAAEPALGDAHRYVQLARKHQINNLFSLSKYQQANDLINTHFATVPDPKTAVNNFGYEILQLKANALYVLGQFEAAKAAAERGLQWLAEYPKSGPMNEASGRTVLALVLIEMGDADAGVKELQQVLAITERVYGTDNQEYLETLINLSAGQKAQKKLDDALATNQQAYQLAQQIYGEEVNLTRIAITGNLANMLVEQGDVSRGEQYMREALQMSTSQYTRAHVETLKLEYNLAELLNNQGQHATAAPMAAATHAKKAEVLGATHPYTWLSMDNWAIGLAGLGQFEAALPKHRQVVRGLSAAIGEAHPYTWLVMRHEVESLLAAEQVTQAANRLQAMITVQQQNLPEGHPDLAANQAWLNQLQSQ